MGSEMTNCRLSWAAALRRLGFARRCLGIEATHGCTDAHQTHHRGNLTSSPEPAEPTVWRGSRWRRAPASDRRRIAGRSRSMTNRAQITRQAARDGVPAPAVERDDVLAHIIAALGVLDDSHGLVFKGGTALRLYCFEDCRDSAHLDFSRCRCQCARQVGRPRPGRLP